MNRLSRTRLLFGGDAVTAFSRARVAVFGLGGVGGSVVEALARSGIGTLDIVDNDTVSVTNLNRQIIATSDTVGRKKTDVMAERILSVAPNAAVNRFDTFVLPETVGEFPFSEYDYVVDAIDTVSGKIAIITEAIAAGVPVISSMGTGNKLDPCRLRISDIYSTSVCPLARVMRKELRARGVERLKVLWSDEEPRTPDPEEMRACMEEEEQTVRRNIPGSYAVVPPAAGLMIAGEVLRDLAGMAGDCV